VKRFVLIFTAVMAIALVATINVRLSLSSQEKNEFSSLLLSNIVVVSFTEGGESGMLKGCGTGGYGKCYESTVIVTPYYNKICCEYIADLTSTCYSSNEINCCKCP
jgi:hypothetical protein